MDLRNNLMAKIRTSPVLGFIRKMMTKSELKRAYYLYELISEYLTPRTKHILDIGAGTCLLAEVIQRTAGKNVTAVDVNNFNLSEVIQPVLYDGNRIPFADKSFDLALIICVLHHAPREAAGKILKEAKRVAKQVLVMEDIYYNTFQKYYTFFMDSVTNYEFFGHPHSNRTDEEWLALMYELGFKVMGKKYPKYHNSFQLAVYALDSF